MSNRFYTILIVPEKSHPIKRIQIPKIFIQTAIGCLGFITFVVGIMAYNYWILIHQVHENYSLKTENFQLRQQVQIFENKLSYSETIIERMQNFATRLKLILHLENGFVPPTTEKREPASKPTSFNIESRLSNTIEFALQTEAVLQDAYEVLRDKKAFLAALPTLQPAAGYMSSGFGVRYSPFDNKMKMHEGIDIANRIGTTVHAAADGEIIFAGPKAGYGLTIIIRHGYGIETWYAHLHVFHVRKSSHVKRGQKIALLGNSGRATGPHVHYEVRVNGYPVDPTSYILEGHTNFAELKH